MASPIKFSELHELTQKALIDRNLKKDVLDCFDGIHGQVVMLQQEIELHDGPTYMATTLDVGDMSAIVKTGRFRWITGGIDKHGRPYTSIGL